MLKALLLAALLPVAAYAQVNDIGGANVTRSPSSALVTATGGTTARTLADRASDVVNIKDFGAKCDGSTDDAAAINAAITALRSRSSVSGTLAWPIGRVGRLVAPGGKCVIKSSLNLTGFYGSGLLVDFGGTALICQTNGTPCVDATGLGQSRIQGLSIYGSITNSPNIGLALGRITNNGSGADHNIIDQPTITGYFTLAPYFNNQSETTLVQHATFLNQQASAYGAIWDGSNHFNIQSAFTGQTYPQDTFLSFNENTCVECTVGTYGANSVPVWIGGSARHKFINGYVFYSSSTASAPEPGLQLYFGPTGTLANDYLDLDIHFEDFAGQHNMTSLVQFVGGTNPTVHGLRMRDNYPEQSGPIFSRGAGVSTVTIQGGDVAMGTLAGQSPSWWDSASAFTYAGSIYSGDGSFTAPGSMNGFHCLAATCTSDFPLPSSLTASTISNPGGVGSVTLTVNGNYKGGSTPTATIAAPPAGGQQASFTFPMKLWGPVTTVVSGGSGYTVNDILTSTGGTCTLQPQVKVTSVDGSGAVTAVTFNGNGECTVTSGPNVSYSGGTGTGVVLTGAAWIPDVANGTITPGAGYTSAPAITFTTIAGSTTSQGTTSLNSSFSATAGAGQMQLTSAGTTLGISGTGGAPVLMAGAIVDSTGQRQSLGSTYTVPANTSLVRFTQGTTVATSTITLPSVHVDGQPIQFVNYAGSITALTFSPSVNGWTNGSTLAANTGLRIRWDATASAWYREQ